MGWKLDGTGIGRTFRLHNVNHLWDHVARAANHHFVTNAQAQAGNFIGVMQRGVTYQHASHLHRLQTRHRRNRPRTPYLKLHVANEGHLLLRRELKGYRPARRTGHKS
ncbi:Uncharacterised protein [Enterobacter cloacae]|nr:Uncharacterised protein [Enterobacter cloacae]